ncbi:hypothetical protein H6F77_19165 [Microcoleus sp. FACHB-831]|uniref:hypothetical protein n=1 Tax=Microcoleus sp. FACHB-831 TaxID=2692827 RepID=UPI001685AEE5|nr:hypothetical protein [Microcoleus sp. FACHB-831]MBD1923176.1 hypothetical protein [Microcoleus sp. FACHB-831]
MGWVQALALGDGNIPAVSLAQFLESRLHLPLPGLWSTAVGSCDRDRTQKGQTNNCS